MDQVGANTMTEMKKTHMENSVLIAFRLLSWCLEILYEVEKCGIRFFSLTALSTLAAELCAPLR